MKIAFPYMGCVTGYRRIFELLGHEVVMPAKPTKGTIDRGVKHSPEFICFPFKVIMGTYIECAEAGAEVIITSGGDGPCRAGLYALVHEKILRSMGHSVDFIVFDSLFRDFKAFFRKLIRVKGNASLGKLAYTCIFGYRMVRQMDQLEKRIKRERAYETGRGDFTRAWKTIVSVYEDCWTHGDLTRAWNKACLLLDAIPLRSVAKNDRIRVGIVGEIYVVMESATNMDIEENLNRLGVEVETGQYISDWVNHNIRPGFLGHSPSHKVIEKAKRFVGMNFGGHDMENVGWMVDYRDRGFDGVIHLMPFGCLPELVTQSAIPTISKELGFPILSLSLDEQMGAVNNQTRLEAFTDLIHSARRKAAAVVYPQRSPWQVPFTPLSHIGFQRRYVRGTAVSEAMR